MKGQIGVTPAIHQTKIPALLDSWVTDTSSVKMSCLQTQKNPCTYIFIKTYYALNVGLSRISQVFFLLSPVKLCISGL
jgi:hypothetical protein